MGSLPRRYPPEILEFILCPETLQKQAFLSLKQRCSDLWNRFRLHISPHGLTNLYKRHGIGYRLTRTQTRRIIADDDLQLNLRKTAARDLLNLVASTVPLVYIDETTLQVSFASPKGWKNFYSLEELSFALGWRTHTTSTCLSSKFRPQSLSLWQWATS